MEYTGHCDTPLGGVTLAGEGEFLTGLWFDGQKHFAAGLDPEHEPGDLPVFRYAEGWLERFFAGEDPGDAPPLWLKGTEFQKAVWDILLTIPRGQTATYGRIAQILAEKRGSGRVSARAVGCAVGRNPVSLIVPCHRIVGADGSLTGYAGGIERKRKLLELEGADSSVFRLPGEKRAVPPA